MRVVPLHARARALGRLRPRPRADADTRRQRQFRLGRARETRESLRGSAALASAVGTKYWANSSDFWCVAEKYDSDMDGAGANGAAKAESARQALLLVAQRLGTNAAEVRAAREERDAARSATNSAVGWLVKWLLSKDTPNFWKLVTKAVAHGQTEVLKCAIQISSTIHPGGLDKDMLGRVSVVAAICGRVDCLRLLSTAGASVKSSDHTVQSLLMRNTDSVRLLLDAGIDVRGSP